MSRNANAHFSQVPRADIQRSRWKTTKRVLTTMNAGQLVPIYNTEVLPGDTLSIETASLVRMSTPIFPVMDNCFMDIYFFFVPNRIIWDHWRELNGENRNSYWAPTTEYRVPTVSSPAQTGFNKGSLADHMEWPTNVPGYVGSALYFRAYVAIWNEFFRDQNYMPPAHLNTGDISILGYTASGEIWDGITDAIRGGQMLPVSKFHDYFTSVLPSPQKGEPMEIPYFKDSLLPVGTFDSEHSVSIDPIHFDGLDVGPNVLTIDSDGYMVGISNSLSGNFVPLGLPNNLWTDLSEVTVGTISELRQAFQIQRLLERDARSGTRYTEILNAHFGVTSPDARLQRPEYLGGKRIPINIDQVLQTSATNEVSPQGNTAAFSLTSDRSNSFTKSFFEHGIVLALACFRTDHTYQQGLNKRFSRRDRFDYYWPALAHISEQPVLRKEINISGADDINDQVFGYQEAWAEYRYEPSAVTGAFRSNYDDGSLDAWHYADYFNPHADVFIADRDFMAETKVNIDRTLAVSSDVEDQFLCNFAFHNTWVRPMPLFSVPGLIDHF